MSDVYPEPSELGDPIFENVSQDPRLSFRWHSHGYPAPLAKWNFHPEYELHLIRCSSGHYVVGDYVGRFGPGNLVLIGPNLPHCWYSDLAADDEVIEQRDVVAQFRGEWLDALMQVCPELRCVKALIKDCERGVLFTGSGAVKGALQLQALGRIDRLKRVSKFIELLGALSRNSYRLMASQDYRLRHAAVRSEQVDAILRYLHRTFDQPVRMEEIARWQGMTPSSFSRFFKQATGDTFTTFVRRLRIHQACRLLQDPSNSVVETCFMSGYSNISNFNRHFRRMVGMTPREYRQSLDASSAEGVQAESGAGMSASATARQ